MDEELCSRLARWATDRVGATASRHRLSKSKRHPISGCLAGKRRFSDYVYSVEGEDAVGKLHQVGSIKIRVNANDHLPPHFHVIAPDFEALVEIETLAVLCGGLPTAARKAVMSWIEENRTTIAAEWNRINPRFPIA